MTERSWEIESGASGRTVCSYGSDGRLAEALETGTNPDGSSWTLRRAYTYDSRGRLVREQLERADGSLVRTRQPFYAADGRRIEERQFERRSRGACCGYSIEVDGSNESFPAPARARSGRITYEPGGAPAEITFKGRLGVPVGKILFQTDAAGRTTAVRSYGDSGEVGSAANWSRPIGSVVNWTARRVLNGWTRWNLIRRGRWRTLGRTLFWGPLWFETFKQYDAHGRRVEERTRFAGGAAETIETWNYDADGRLLEHGERDETGKLTTREEYVYELDAIGNWVHRTITRPRRPHAPEEMIDITARTIDYFDQSDS